MALPDWNLLYHLFGLLTNKLFENTCGMHSSGSTSALMEQPNMAGFSVITNTYGEGFILRASWGASRFVFLHFLLVVVLIVQYDGLRYDGLRKLEEMVAGLEWPTQ